MEVREENVWQKFQHLSRKIFILIEIHEHFLNLGIDERTLDRGTKELPTIRKIFVSNSFLWKLGRKMCGRNLGIYLVKYLFEWNEMHWISFLNSFSENSICSLEYNESEINFEDQN